ncbi:MAG: YmfQ family protein [Promethearchaeota archaeon]
MKNASEYLRLLRSLFPKGAIWTTEPDSVLYEFLYGQAEEFARVDSRSDELLIERDTRSTTELLVDHEIDLALPDSCFVNEILTIAQRRNNAHAELINAGGQTPQFFIDFANDLGFTITIEEYGAFITGEGSGGISCGDNFFIWKITINIGDGNIIYFSAGESSAGDYLSIIPSLTPLMCILTKLKPAHTQLLFGYDGPEFYFGFSSAFDSFFSGTNQNYLEGAFSKAFNSNFNVYWGGEFDETMFSLDFDKPI